MKVVYEGLIPGAISVSRAHKIIATLRDYDDGGISGQDAALWEEAAMIMQKLLDYYVTNSMCQEKSGSWM